MRFSKKEQWTAFIIVNSILLLCILLFPLYDKITPNLVISQCNMLRYLHLYCPACGGTRALRALLHFDIIDSILCNPMVAIGFGWIIAYEIGMIINLPKKGDREILLKPWMIYVTLGVWAAYTIGRNLLLLWGIDLLGNIIPHT